jgi:serine phosphatase RsbU (regulator of sigma subunit)
MGDVCGKGVAAASLTALARYTVRAGAIEGAPASVLRLLNRAILDSDAGERFCTIAHARLEPSEGRARVTLACGGHPLPLLLRADGTVEEVGLPGTAVGLFPEVQLTEVELTLEAGDALAFYTDGFTEARTPDGRFDNDLLPKVLATAAGHDAEGIAEIVEREVLAFQGGRPRDDMALLVVRVRP